MAGPRGAPPGRRLHPSRLGDDVDETAAGGGFRVDPAALTAAAGRIRPLAADLAGIGPRVSGPVAEAATDNLDLATSLALVQFDERLSPVAQALGAGLTGHADALDANAQGYRAVEQGNAERFRTRG
jgi:hypothetical protein